MKIKSMKDILNAKSVLLVGIGGGGDAVSAATLSSIFNELKIKTYVAGVLWERWVKDPFPGPIPLEIIKNAKIKDGYAIITPETYVDRGLCKFKPTLAEISKIISSITIAFDISKGGRGLLNALTNFTNDFNIELILGIDVGGDVLALGHEDNLWSPLTDQTVLAVLANISIPSLLGIIGVGGDGELSDEYVIKRISDIALLGGFLGSIGLFKNVITILERLINNTQTEASKIPYLALKGYSGNYSIRNGTRNVKIDVSKSVAYLLDPQVVFKNQELPKRLVSTNSIYEAMVVANNLGIYTELNFELDICKAFGSGKTINYQEVMNLAKKRKEIIRRKKKL